MNKALAGDMPILAAAQHGVFGIWTAGGLLKPPFEYARATLKTWRSPIAIARSVSLRRLTDSLFPGTMVNVADWITSLSAAANDTVAERTTPNAGGAAPWFGKFSCTV